MSSPSKTILITGATGKQGGAVIQALLSSSHPQPPPFQIVAVTRDTESRSAQSLAALPNVSVIKGDLSDVNAIFKQAGPVWGVFSVQVNSDAEEEQGTALVDAAVSRGVQHFVYASGDRGGPERSDVDPTSVKNFAAKFNIEKYVRKQAAAGSFSYTILRPVTFFDNLTPDIHGKGFARMWQQMGSKKLQLISTTDIGWFAAQAFLHPDDVRYRNAALTLVGDELTQEEADVIFRESMGSSMPMVPCPVGSAVKWFKKDTVGDMFHWFEKVGYGGDVEECRRIHPGMQDYRTWLRDCSAFVKSSGRCG